MGCIWLLYVRVSAIRLWCAPVDCATDVTGWLLPSPGQASSKFASANLHWFEAASEPGLPSARAARLALKLMQLSFMPPSLEGLDRPASELVNLCELRFLPVFVERMEIFLWQDMLGCRKLSYFWKCGYGSMRRTSHVIWLKFEQ